MYMAATTIGKRWRAADLQKIPSDNNRYEIIDGELLVTPAPSLDHQEIAAQFFERLRAYLRDHRVGNAYFAPADAHFSDNTVVEPDLLVVPRVHGKQPRDWKSLPRPLLVIEILSPRTARVDTTIKRRLYQSEGIPEYWIVNGRARSVERWRPEDSLGETISDRLEWRADPDVPPLVIDLVQLFADVFDA